MSSLDCVHHFILHSFKKNFREERCVGCWHEYVGFKLGHPLNLIGRSGVEPARVVVRLVTLLERPERALTATHKARMFISKEHKNNAISFDTPHRLIVFQHYCMYVYVHTPWHTYIKHVDARQLVQPLYMTRHT